MKKNIYYMLHLYTYIDNIFYSYLYAYVDNIFYSEN